jgi:hypothetical protein
MGASEALLSDRVLDAGQPTRAPYPDERGFVVGEHVPHWALTNSRFCRAVEA